ncbi:hypothetical protein SCATT_24610 [Streptantibioticus cattleyicolor NRRL 8057 = DSM 46488]|uniref:Uncharacterized protein n=1 Tax=Streptantibioticus cattleyicolor (strain ATCC 35852 / DSM 46488 / JCM 4925 / NBRC 14057 / NRRL 8057) TaxID=1003195 RepID=G8WU10_STREN|nr:hypothetical protein SCATT_24610 [Streptantibioticus cattleyicolor NRRL 8057 = DSM 46488]
MRRGAGGDGDLDPVARIGEINEVIGTGGRDQHGRAPPLPPRKRR